MKLQSFSRAGIVGLLFMSLASATSASPQEVFVSRSFDAAQRDAVAEGKYFLISASADWCVPCRRMDATTWADGPVTEWIAGNAVAVKIDVDEHPELAKQLRVSALPTVIVWQAGAEFDRVVGYKDPEMFLAWLDGVTRGEREIDRLREAAADRMDDDGNVDIRARLKLAQELARTPGSLDEATEEFVWLWDNMLEYRPSMYGVRLSFMVGDMTALARRHTPAREAFKALRDRYDPLPTSDGQVLIDWVNLNEVIDDEDATLAWFDRFKGELDDPRTIRALEIDLLPLLSSRGRWADIAIIYPDEGRLMTALERERASTARLVERLASRPASDVPEGVPEEEIARREQMRRAAPLRTFREKWSRIYAGLLAANRDGDADQVAAFLIEDQDIPEARRALIEAAVEAGEPRPLHLEWLDEAEAIGGEQIGGLRSRLERALRER